MYYQLITCFISRLALIIFILIKTHSFVSFNHAVGVKMKENASETIVRLDSIGSIQKYGKKYTYSDKNLKYHSLNKCK